MKKLILAVTVPALCSFSFAQTSSAPHLDEDLAPVRAGKNGDIAAFEQLVTCFCSDSVLRKSP